MSLHSGVDVGATFLSCSWAVRLNFFLFFLTVVQSSSISYWVKLRLRRNVLLICSACSARSSSRLPMVSRWWPVILSMDRIPFFSTRSLLIFMISFSERCLR